MKLNLCYRLPLILFCGFIFWQSSFPSVISQPLFPHDDKFMHAGAYALMAILAARWIQQERKGWSVTKVKLLAMIFTVLYGLSDEIHQAFVPARNASTLDWAADFLGALIGIWIYGRFLSPTSKKGFPLRKP